MSDELKNCPHCGNSDHLKVTRVEGETLSPDNFQVVCSWLSGGCGASGGVRRTQAEAIAAWNQRADEFGADDDYERRMDELLCRLTNGKWSKSRSYSVDFMVSCVDEAYDEILNLPVESHYAPRNTRAETNVTKSETNGNTREANVIEQTVESSEADSREQLEEAMRNVIRDALLNLKTAIMCCVEQGMDVLSFDEREFVDFEPEEYVDEYLLRAMHLLDRQASITERELCDRCSPYATASDYLDTIDSLTAERDGLRKQLAEKQRVIDMQRDSFAKMERECAELRQMPSDAAEAI